MGNMLMIGKTSMSDLRTKTELDPPKTSVINDKREILKLKFPFYRMEVRHFEILLEDVCLESKHISTDRIKTQVFTLNRFKEVFCKVTLIDQYWDRVERLMTSRWF